MTFKLTRRELLAGAAATAGMTALPFGMGRARAAPSGILKVIPHASLTILDPVATTGYIVRNHGYLIYDTLFAQDANLDVRPQMASGVEVSDDGLTYRISLRDGLAWHDGSPVTAEDCALSLIRWGQVDGMGRRLFSYMESCTHDGTGTIVLTLSRPYGLVLQSIGKLSTNVPFMMPKRFAEKPTSERLTAEEQVGSGPFRFVASEFRPGARVVYERNPDYVPRDEPASNAAGGKVVHLDGVEWINFPDPNTQLNALMTGEVDYWEQVPADLAPIVAGMPGVRVENFNPLGNVGMARFNSLVGASANPGVRRAIVRALDQTALLQAAVGSPDYYKECFSVFPCETTFANDASSSFIQEPDLEDAKRLLAESGYDGEPFVVLATTDIPVQTNYIQVIVDTMRRMGINVDAQAMDWATVLQRRASRNPVEDGGWNMFVTWWEGADLLDPVVQFAMSAAGDGAWVGWAQDDVIEGLRTEFAEAGSIDDQKEIARKIQSRFFEQNFHAVLGQFFTPTGYRDNVSGILEAPPFFWNIQKS
ncbi:ABC transporter substrate-binding protein [Salinarimonas chemoclinalis]|uniref:ABC transporter substrate-binding protein n=1 Tax=Salinarimonas chemoclinalis TaxID=3241599 RepID=UPI0035568DEF